MPTPAETTVRVRTLADQAIAAALESDWQRAAELNKQILDVSPEDVEARNRYGRALLEVGKLDEARAAYQEVVKAYPHDPIALRQIARIADRSRRGIHRRHHHTVHVLRSQRRRRQHRHQR